MTKWASKPINKLRGKKLISSLLLLFILLFFLSSKEALVLSDVFTGEVLAVFSAAKGFSIAYTHSVERSEVIESYLLENGRLLLIETWLHSYGAGLPATTEYDFEIRPEGFHIYNINQYFDEVIYRSGKGLANHRLLIGKKEYLFAEFSRPGEAILFRPQKVSRWKLLLGGVH
ncbi:MAG: DUF1850 domain-containing protein [Tissierellia bacterium]|nr:DUF1850 domain-containing protein [Tissierellia bacterium]